nr:hypothetical protein [Tanacetum cinerariifolium]
MVLLPSWDLKIVVTRIMGSDVDNLYYVVDVNRNMVDDNHKYRQAFANTYATCDGSFFPSQMKLSGVVVQGQWFTGCDSGIAVQWVSWVYLTSK